RSLFERDRFHLQRVALDIAAYVDAEMILLVRRLELREDLLVACFVKAKITVVAGDDAEAAAGALEGALARVAVRRAGGALRAVGVHNRDIVEGLSAGEYRNQQCC